MKNLGIFLLGLATGLTAGGVAGYFVTRKKCDEMIDREIEAYAEYTEAKIEHMKALLSEGAIEEPERKDEEVQKNEGVKKYHHQNESISSIAGRQPFGKKETEEKEMAGTWDQPTDDIIEISEEEFLKTFTSPDVGPYSKIALDLLFDGETEDEDWDNQLYWGYGTDNEMLAMLRPEYQTKHIRDILGEVYRWCIDYVDEDETVGSFFVRNHILHQDIECIVHDLRG